MTNRTYFRIRPLFPHYFGGIRHDRSAAMLLYAVSIEAVSTLT
jgi:hypothetical protein